MRMEQEAKGLHYLVKIVSAGGFAQSVYQNRSFTDLPRGASLLPHGNTSALNNPVSYRLKVLLLAWVDGTDHKLQWIPERLQEGFTYVLTLQAAGYINTTSVFLDSLVQNTITVRLKVIR
eukprot:767620-Hanusia_phi.AAC.8